MADIEALRSQQYSDNLVLLSQQMKPKLSPYCMKQSATGSKAFRMLSQLDNAEAIDITTSATPAMNQSINHDGRWVYPSKKGFGKVVDDIDTLQTNISPEGAYVRSALAALNRKEDEMFAAAFFGTAQTGETGATSTTFPAANQVAVTVGGSAATGLNVEKLRAAKQILLEGDVDLDMEQIYIAMAPEQHDNLLALTQVVSTDFNDRPVLVNGRVQQFLGMNVIISNYLPLDSSSYRRLPVWVPSGMGCGIWKETNGRIRNRSDLFGEPLYVEADFMKGFTRLEEAKCVEIKCAEV